MNIFFIVVLLLPSREHDRNGIGRL
jgi:hypothetical protein